MIFFEYIIFFLSSSFFVIDTCILGPTVGATIVAVLVARSDGAIGGRGS